MSEKKYYYQSEGQKKGPYTVKELADQGLKPSSLIWVEEIDNWIHAKDIPDIIDYFKNQLHNKQVSSTPASNTSENNTPEGNAQETADIKEETTLIPAEVRISANASNDTITVNRPEPKPEPKPESKPESKPEPRYYQNEPVNEITNPQEYKKDEYRQLFENFYGKGKISATQRNYLIKKQTELGLDQSITRQLEIEITRSRAEKRSVPQKEVKQKKSKKGLLLIIIGIVVIVIAIWAIYPYFKNNNNTQPDYEIAMTSGNIEFDNKDFSKSLVFYNEALTIIPDDPNALEKIKQATDSIAFYYDKNMADGDLMKSLPLYEDAQMAYLEALNWKPNDPVATARLREIDSLVGLKAAELALHQEQNLAEEDEAKRLAEEEAELLAIEEADRIAKEDAKRKADEESRRLIKEQEKNGGTNTPVYGSFVDYRDWKTYKTVQLGTQTWMAENLKYASTTGSWCYKDESGNCDTYGRLYNWEAAKNAAPTGWHLPTDAEWTTLINFLGGESVAGGKLKSTSLWNSPNTDANNSSGFSVVPSGFRDNSDDSYSNKGYNCYLWSANEKDGSNSWLRALDYQSGEAKRSSYGKELGFSVRCIKD